MKTITLYGRNGNLDCVTEQGETHITSYTTPGSMFTVLDNTASTRKFLAMVLRRMRGEAHRDAVKANRRAQRPVCPGCGRRHRGTNPEKEYRCPKTGSWYLAEKITQL